MNKRNCILYLLLLILATKVLYAQSGATIKVISYNIKYDDTRDSVNNWSKRKGEVIGLLRYHEADLVGIQEGLLNQVEDIKNGLPGFNYVGVGRDDGKKAGEYCAIFYNSRNFNLVDSGTFWLAPQPDKPLVAWDAAFPRICTWVKLNHLYSGKTLYLFNSHFDHIGAKAREESAKQILKRIREIDPQHSVITMGDFNFEPYETPYDLMSKQLIDAKTVSKTKPYGPAATFNGFDFHTRPSRRIDYIFLRGPLEVLKYTTISDSKDMAYPSDHFPVFVELIVD